MSCIIVLLVSSLAGQALFPSTHLWGFTWKQEKGKESDQRARLEFILHSMINLFSGQFYHPKVRISNNYKVLHLADGRVVPVEEGAVFKATVDQGFKDQSCWYPVDGQSVIEGQSWNYIVEHIMSTKFEYSLYKT